MNDSLKPTGSLPANDDLRSRISSPIDDQLPDEIKGVYKQEDGKWFVLSKEDQWVECEKPFHLMDKRLRL